MAIKETEFNDKEAALYPPVEKWMLKHFHCFDSAINKGLSHGRIDVIGLKDIGGDFSGETETIAIEVKRGMTPFANACGQTFGYRVYANRVYLADSRVKPFSPTEIHIASTLGIGLIHIQSNRCEEILSSPYYNPITRLNLGLLEKMGYGKCQLCDAIFSIQERDKKNKPATPRNLWSNLARVPRTAVKSDGEKGLMFWNQETSERKEKHAMMTGIRDRRFLCKECVQRLQELRPSES